MDKDFINKLKELLKEFDYEKCNDCSCCLLDEIIMEVSFNDYYEEFDICSLLHKIKDKIL